MEGESRKWAGDDEDDDDDAPGSEFFVWVTTRCIAPAWRHRIAEECLWFPHTVQTVNKSRGHRYIHTEAAVLGFICVTIALFHPLMTKQRMHLIYLLIWQIYVCYGAQNISYYGNTHIKISVFDRCLNQISASNTMSCDNLLMKHRGFKSNATSSRHWCTYKGSRLHKRSNK